MALTNLGMAWATTNQMTPTTAARIVMTASAPLRAKGLRSSVIGTRCA